MSKHSDEDVDIDLTDGKRVYIQTKALGEVFMKEINGELYINIEGTLSVIPNSSNSIKLK